MARVLSIAVKPNAKASQLSQDEAGRWTARLAAPPVDGKANEELIALVARHFGVRRSAVTIKSGAGARLKLIEIDV